MSKKFGFPANHRKPKLDTMQRSMDCGALSPCAHISITVSAAMAPGTTWKGVRKLCQKTRMSPVKHSLLEMAVKTETTTITMESPSLDKAVGDY